MRPPWRSTSAREFEQAMVLAQDGVQLAETLDHPYSLVIALRAFGRVHGARGDFGRGICLAERSLALSHDRNLAQLSPEVSDLLGLLAQSGNVVEGLPLLEGALRAMESM